MQKCNGEESKRREREVFGSLIGDLGDLHERRRSMRALVRKEEIEIQRKMLEEGRFSPIDPSFLKKLKFCWLQ